MSETANFFWVGNPLTIYEELSLKSFLLNNFIVRLWTYDKIEVPLGVEIMDAEQILPKQDLYKYKQGGKEKNLAAFSDIFRFKLLSEKNGEWWFDIDCVCLKDEKEFTQLKKDKKIVVGWEDSNFLNGACLNFIDNEIGVELVTEKKKIVDNKTNLMWGEIGPRLLTNCLIQNNLLDDVVGKNFFYSIHYTQTSLMNNPTHTEFLKELTNKSYLTHLWNEILSNEVNKNQRPTKNSFLDYLFNLIDNPTQ